jgi:hypothetical protein
LVDSLILRRSPDALACLAIVALLGFLAAKIPVLVVVFFGVVGLGVGCFRGAVPQKEKVEA